MHRRFIRDTVANDYRTSAQVELDRRMKWLDEVYQQCVLQKPEHEIKLSE